MLDFNRYQFEAKKTAIYPPHLKTIYPVIGLAGETGEVCEKIKKILRDKNGVIDETDREEVTKELGDVLWYVSAIASDIGVELKDVAEGNLQKLHSRKERDMIRGSGDNR